MKWLILIPLMVVCGCVGYYKILSGDYPKSLSATSLYGKYGKWVFGGSMVFSAIFTWLCCTSVLSDGYLWFAWLACVSLLLVAWFNSETKVHTIAARTAGVMMTILTAAICPLALLAWSGYVAYTLLTEGKHKILVAEICCVVEMTLTILTT